jgi:hypothetical protein
MACWGSLPPGYSAWGVGLSHSNKHHTLLDPLPHLTMLSSRVMLLLSPDRCFQPAQYHLLLAIMLLAMYANADRASNNCKAVSVEILGRALAAHFYSRPRRRILCHRRRLPCHRQAPACSGLLGGTHVQANIFGVT